MLKSLKVEFDLLREVDRSSIDGKTKNKLFSLERCILKINNLCCGAMEKDIKDEWINKYDRSNV